jgi:alginate O-acetyltransferase complex protein AlgI
MWIIIASVVFFVGYGRISLGALFLSVSFNAVIGYLIYKKKISAIPGIIVNIAFLCFFKYNGSIIMPVAVSFYTFSQIAFLIELKKGNIEKYDLLEYLSFILFFPKIMQGPLADYKNISGQIGDLKSKRILSDDVLYGIILFTLGLAKKVLLSDALGIGADYGYQNLATLTALDAVIVSLCFTFQLYFDFSGYCDMAMGISQMLGIRLPVNFNSPFQATNQRDFWKRWHMTLTRFFTRYVYIPLGGSRKGVLRTIVNTLLVFLLSGLWHGLGITYLVWGAINGVFVVVSHFLSKLAGDGGKQPENPKKGGTFGRIRTFAAFLFTLVFFRSESVEMAVAMLKRFLIPLYPGFLLRTAEHLNIVELYPLTKALSLYLPGTESTVQLILWILLLILGFFLIRRKNAYEIAAEMPLKAVYIAPLALLFAWSMLAFNNVGTFLYFAY